MNRATKIFIGITTHASNENLTECIDAIRELTTSNFEIVVGCDSEQSVEYCRKMNYKCFGGENKGIAYNKNRLFTYAQDVVKDYDYIFMFDDDCFPTKKGWDEWIVEGMDKSGLGHWIYLPGDHYGDVTKKRKIDLYELKEHKMDGGCLFVMNKATVDAVGGMHPAFYANKYGGEHSDLFRRINRLPNNNGFYRVSFTGCEDWIEGHDWMVYRGAEAFVKNDEKAKEINKMVTVALRIHHAVKDDPVYQDYKVKL